MLFAYRSIGGIQLTAAGRKMLNKKHPQNTTFLLPKERITQ